MIAAEDCTLVLLAAGRSTRFGAADKLAADLDGKPVGFHAADMLAGMAFGRQIAVVGATTLDFAARGYRVVRNPAPARGLSSSIRLGIAEVGDAAAVMIALADMPRLTEAHVRRLLAAANGAGAVVASSDGARSSPPVVVGRGHFGHLLSLEGDVGARRLVAAGLRVDAAAAELVDIDTVDDLRALAGPCPMAG